MLLLIDIEFKWDKQNKQKANWNHNIIKIKIRKSGCVTETLKSHIVVKYILLCSEKRVKWIAKKTKHCKIAAQKGSDWEIMKNLNSFDGQGVTVKDISFKDVVIIGEYKWTSICHCMPLEFDRKLALSATKIVFIAKCK